MVGIFVRLKLTILRNRLGRSSVWGVIGFVLIWMTSLGAAVGGGALMAVAGRFLDPPDVVPPLVFSAVSIGWVIGPLVAASFDDALDPRRFEALPLARTELGVGMAAAGMVSPGGVATTIGLLIGTLAGFANAWTLLPLVLVVMVEVVLSAVTARFVLTLLSDILRSRRMREVMGVVVAMTAAIPGVLSGLINTGVLRVEGDLATFTRPLGLFPPGALGRAVTQIGDGDWLGASAGLAYGLVALAAVMLGYGWSLDRLQVVADTGLRARGGRRGAGLRPAWLRLPRGPVGAVAAKELAYFRRDPRVRGQLIGSLIGLAVIATVALPVIRSDYGAFLSVPMAFFVVLALLVNQFGYDGGAFWMYLVVAPSMVDVLRGKNLAGGLFAGALATLSAVVGAFLSGAWVHFPAAVMAAAAIVIVWAAVGNATSVAGPIRIPDKTVFSSQGLSGSAFLASMAGLAGAGILLLPVIAAMFAGVWFGGPLWGAATSVVTLGYAVVVYRLSFRLSVPLMERNLARLLEVIDEA